MYLKIITHKSTFRKKLQSLDLHGFQIWHVAKRTILDRRQIL